MIVLAGTIGAGKTCLATELAKHFQSEAFYESTEDNEVLPLFYADPEKYTFLLQVHFLNRKFANIKQASLAENNILDRSIYEDSLLFHLNADLGRASAVEVHVYDELFQNMMEEMPSAIYRKQPDLLVHIKVSFETMLERIKKRGRSYEQLEFDPTLYDYYKTLNERYEEWYAQYQESPKLQIDGDLYNFVEDPQALEFVLKLIDEKMTEIRQGELVHTKD